ncbi:MAG: hypothetical protein IJ860_08225 [Eubacterium sp.]|nr:hypothetical protein [Eubacterium sp.]
MRKRIRNYAAIILASAVVLAGCGSGQTSSGQADTGSSSAKADTAAEVETAASNEDTSTSASASSEAGSTVSSDESAASGSAQSASAAEDTAAASSAEDGSALDSLEGGDTPDALKLPGSSSDDAGAAAAPGGLHALSAKKTASLAIDSRMCDFKNSGIIYQNDQSGNYGVLTSDGTHDTGDIYTSAREADNYYPGYFIVSSSKADVSNVNVNGLIDAEGNEIIPCEYGFISLLSDRYAKVITSSGQTTNEEEALFYYTDSFISFTPDEDDIMFKGSWQVYDMQKKALVPGVSGTNRYSIDVKGSYITYVTDDETRHTVDQDGNEVSDDLVILSNGACARESDGKAVLYSPEGEELFSYDSTETYVQGYAGYDTYTAADYDMNHYLLDEKGNVLTPGLQGTFGEVFPDCFIADDQLLNYSGEPFLDGSYTALYYDEVYEDVYSARKDDTYVVFDKEGNVLYQDDEHAADDVYKDIYAFSIKNADSKSQYYNYSTGTYSIEGSTNVSHWLVSQQDNDKHNLFETRTGKMLIEGYEQYAAVEDKTSHVTWVYASNEGSIDVYEVSAVG